MHNPRDREGPVRSVRCSLRPQSIRSMAPLFSNEVSMATERLPKRKIRDVLPMKFDNGLSECAIARAPSTSAGGLNGYLQLARVAGLSWPLREVLDDTALERLPFPPASARSRPFLRNDRTEETERAAMDWECLGRKALEFLRLASIRLMLRKLCIQT